MNPATARLFVRDRGRGSERRRCSTEANDDCLGARRGRALHMEITMTALEGRLDPASFLHHRRFIINMDHAASIPHRRIAIEVKL